MANAPINPPITAAKSAAKQPVGDTTAWIRLPRAGTRCTLTGLSRSSLAELVRPCARNGFKAPVAARVLKQRDAVRGILLISRESLLGYLNELPATNNQ